VERYLRLVRRMAANRAYEKDPAVAASEWGGQFRNDLESYVSPEIVEACTDRGVYQLEPVRGVQFAAHADPSGGGSDSFILAIGHVEDGVGILDLLVPPISHEQVIGEFSEVACTGDGTRRF
jgi:hypothetical protein